MTDQLEADIRGALARHAASIPPRSEQLRAADYKPRVSTGRVALVLTTAIVAGAVALTVSVIGLDTYTPRAFAGWTAAPTAAASGQISKARSVCRSQLTYLTRISRERPGLPPIPADKWSAVLIDTRGPYTLILFEAGSGSATSTCFSGRRNQGTLGAAIGTHPPAPVAPGHVMYGSSGSSVTPADEGSRHFGYVVGRTGAGVSGVTIRLDNRTRVAASRAQGWFLAWWPGRHGIRATEVTTASGAHDQ